MNRRHGMEAPPAARISYVMDDVWPEYASMIAASLRPGDQLLAPGLLGPRPARYRWPGPVLHAGALAMARRHLAMRRVARASGGVRQRAYLAADRELARALARRIVTPHHGIAALFPDRAMRLTWHHPPAREPAPGNRVAFLGPTIARQRPDIARALAASLDAPLIVFGDMLEGGDFWAGIPIERRAFGPDWLDGIGVILHPATLTSQPRRLLQALAAGITIYATPASGLDPADYVPIADFAGGSAAIAAEAA
jgi:hypothetical protein